MSEEKHYITSKRLKEIKKEYDELLSLEHAKIKNDSPKFLESEEISSDYLIYQEDISFLQARITELEEVLNNHEIIKLPPKNRQKEVGLGSKVKVKVDGETDEFMILGTLEANPSLGIISNESPVGKALIGKKEGEEVEINSPISVSYKILKIKYPHHLS